MNQDTNSSEFKIKSYQEGRLVINDQEYHHSLILARNELINNWPVQSITELNAKHFEAIIQLKPEIVLLGTGSTLIFPETEKLLLLIKCRIGYEIMDTGAACRTYTILAAEDRKVVAGLIV